MTSASDTGLIRVRAGTRSESSLKYKRTVWSGGKTQGSTGEDIFLNKKYSERWQTILSKVEEPDAQKILVRQFHNSKEKAIDHIQIFRSVSIQQAGEGISSAIGEAREAIKAEHERNSAAKFELLKLQAQIPQAVPTLYTSSNEDLHDKFKYLLEFNVAKKLEWLNQYGDDWVKEARNTAIWELDCMLGAPGETEKLVRRYKAGERDLSIRPGKFLVWFYAPSHDFRVEAGPTFSTGGMVFRQQTGWVLHALLGLHLADGDFRTPSWQEFLEASLQGQASHRCSNRPCVDPFHFTRDTRWQNWERDRELLNGKDCKHEVRCMTEYFWKSAAPEKYRGSVLDILRECCDEVQPLPGRPPQTQVREKGKERMKHYDDAGLPDWVARAQKLFAEK